MSMWTAPSDYDYYGYWDEEPEDCGTCGAYPHQACEQWCESNAPAEEPVPEEALTHALP